jgi:hypothetical protein
MKRYALVLVMLTAGFFAFSCASTGYQSYNTQGGAVVGGALGALAGQAIGRNTGGTLIGAGVGTLVGALVGNAMDQDAAYHRQYARYGYSAPSNGGYGGQESGGGAAGPYYSGQEYRGGPGPDVQNPPGEWVTVPGRWVNGRWVPSHRVWVPVNP